MMTTREVVLMMIEMMTMTIVMIQAMKEKIREMILNLQIQLKNRKLRPNLRRR